MKIVQRELSPFPGLHSVRETVLVLTAAERKALAKAAAIAEEVRTFLEEHPSEDLEWGMLECIASEAPAEVRLDFVSRYV